MAGLKYDDGDTITVMRDGVSVSATVTETDVDSASRPYHVRWSDTDDVGWVRARDVVGGAYAEDRFAVGDHATLADSYQDSYATYIRGREVVIIGIDKDDPGLHYKFQPLPKGNDEDDYIPSDYLYNENAHTHTYGLWARERDLIPIDDGDLPSFNLEATVSESLGMWRPPKVNT